MTDNMQFIDYPKHGDRVETGVTQFGDDWPGVFIRGDSALLGYVPALTLVLNALKEMEPDPAEQLAGIFDSNIVFARAELEALRDLLASCNIENWR